MPTIQGWTIADYQRHARDLRPLIEVMARYYQKQSAWRVGIGTLCRRTRVEMIRQVCAAVAEELPGVPLHLWGVSLRTFRAPFALPAQAISFDRIVTRRKPRRFNGSGQAGLLLGLSPTSGFAGPTKKHSTNQEGKEHA